MRLIRGERSTALAWVMIAEDLVDKPFLDKYCVGYDETTLPEGAPANGHYKAYILGQGSDGIAKTPAWASAITGIPQERIVKLAREIAGAKPAYISQGWGPQRHANGELVSRAISMLAILTGNVGIHGGNSGAREGSYSLPFERMPTLENPVQTSISMFMWTDAIERGPEMTATRDGVRGKDKLVVPIKMIWKYACKCLINQHSQINRTHEILQDDKKCELIVVIDCHMTSSAKYADILLPDCTASEQMDFALDASCGNMAYVIFADQAIKPRFECKTIYEMTTELAKRMGVAQQFTEGRTQEGWMRHLYEQSREAIPELLPFDEFRKHGMFKQRDPEGHHVAYKAFRADPAANPLTTPSGKIEIYSAQLAEIAATWELEEGDVIDPLPVYSPGFENYDDPQIKDYPLQLTGFHYKARTHSTYGFDCAAAVPL
jgi:anaerobic dimethyl sulfoxide reductase subunit A